MSPAAFVRLDLAAARHNLAHIKRLVPGKKVMAVIKANAYGHGMQRLASALAAADGFAVARVDEGVRLRLAGFSQPITVLQGFVCADELQQLLHHQLTPVIHCPEQLHLLQQQPLPAASLSVWLKLDSGMNRLGFKADGFNAAYQQLLSCPAIRQPIALMTHFANADSPDDPKTGEQLALFQQLTAHYNAPTSVANSAALLSLPHVPGDWVRPGLMLYGVSPFADSTAADFNLQPVMSLHARLIAVKQLQPGETVGYSGTWQCTEPTRLGVISMGYGDGYHRHTQSGAPVSVNGLNVPLIGRVSMDMITVNLNSQTHAKPGDPVTLWGQGLPVETLARYTDTIPYTLLCGITQRVAILEHSD